MACQLHFAYICKNIISQTMNHHHISHTRMGGQSMRRVRTILTALLALALTDATACTSVLVSGRATADGRPLLLKNRDTDDLDNLNIIGQGPRYRYVAVVAAKDLQGESTWSGHNEAGFAIINTAAYNLNVRDGRMAHDDGQDGKVMRHALGSCASTADFEAYLDSLKAAGVLNSNSNFGVIDAKGGCAYYEVGNEGYVKFDANDPRVAPDGYLVRTNFGTTGLHSLDQGVERYAAITDLMAQTRRQGAISLDFLLRTVPRYLVHGLTGTDLNRLAPADSTRPVFAAFRDFIPRYLTASAVVVQGVRPGENPLTTVSWTIAGSPLTTVAVPLVITPKGSLPQTVTRNANGYAPLVHAGLALKHRLFPNDRGNGHDYINVAQLINQQQTGILQRVRTIEDETFSRGEQMVARWRSRLADKDAVAYYQWFDAFVRSRYSSDLQVRVE